MNLNNFTIKAAEVVQQAQQLTFNNTNSGHWSRAHLKALLDMDDTPVEYLLKRIMLPLTWLKANLLSWSKTSYHQYRPAQTLWREANNVLLRAGAVLKNLFSDEFVTPEHILLALVREMMLYPNYWKIWGLLKRDWSAAIKDLRRDQLFLHKHRKRSSMRSINMQRIWMNWQGLVNWTPLIGRDEEIRRTLHILSRRSKQPDTCWWTGVGKTAIAEGLAMRIVNGDVPENLKSKTIRAWYGQLILRRKIQRWVWRAFEICCERVTPVKARSSFCLSMRFTLVGRWRWWRSHGCS